MHSRWMTLALISLAIALLLSASRAGVAATGAGLLFVAASQISWRGPRTGQALAMLGVTIAIVSVAFLVAGGALSLRYAANDALPMENARFEIFEIVLGAITTTPWTGTGFGTFSDVFPAYRSPDLSSHFLWDKAHNSYLENALELGLPAMLALNLSIFLLAIRTARGMVERRRDRLFATLGVAATILVGLHSMVDFSLQIPAVSVLYAYLMGLAVSQSWRTTA
jgi:O-antigen ligase